jgi:hypothetical protein
MTSFTLTVLFTDTDGRARFREEAMALDQGTEKARLSALLPTHGLQLRESPVGFRSEFHVSSHPQWVFILQGQMEIGLQDGSSKVFGPGQHFFSADLLPEGTGAAKWAKNRWSRCLFGLEVMQRKLLKYFESRI